MVSSESFPKMRSDSSLDPSEQEDFSHFLRIENLMKGRENASIIDLKMGVSTVTCNIVGNPKRMKKRLLKDKSTTTLMLGMKVIGYVIKNANKEVEEKFYKWPNVTATCIPQVLRKIFRKPP